MRKTTLVKGLAALAASASLLLAPQQAGAWLMAYEGFDYTPNADLSGMNGGFGWITPWGVNTSGATTIANVLGDSAMAGSLLYIDSANRMLFSSGGSAFYTGSGGTSSPFRDLMGAGGAEGSSVYVSFMFQRVGPTVNNTATPFNPYPRAANVSFYDGGSERFAIGNASGSASNNIALIPQGSLGNLVATEDDFSLASLAVVRIDYGADNKDTAYLFVNPSLGLEPVAGDASATATGFDFNFARMRPFAGGVDAGNNRPYGELKVDEIRVGTTWQDVTPFITLIPEPTVATFAGLSLLGLWMRSRRQRG